MELNDYDETAFVARNFIFCHQIVRQKYCFRCNLYLGRNKEAIADARLAVKRQPASVAAKDMLGNALYSAGQFLYLEQNKEAVRDARLAVKSQPDSVAAKDTLGSLLCWAVCKGTG